MKYKTIQEAIWAIDNHIAKNPMDKTELPDIRAFLADYASKRSSIIGDLKNKLIKAQADNKKLRDLLDQIVYMSNIHGVYKNDTDCVNSIREAIFRNLKG